MGFGRLRIVSGRSGVNRERSRAASAPARFWKKMTPARRLLLELAPEKVPRHCRASPQAAEPLLEHCRVERRHVLGRWWPAFLLVQDHRLRWAGGYTKPAPDATFLRDLRRLAIGDDCVHLATGRACAAECAARAVHFRDKICLKKLGWPGPFFRRRQNAAAATATAAHEHRFLRILRFQHQSLAVGLVQ